VNVHGKVRGASSGKVKITIQQRKGRKWKTARRTHAIVSAVGAYSRDVAKLRRGSYRVRARYLGTGSTLPSSSRYHRFSLRG
jgi:hypothetical protein